MQIGCGVYELRIKGRPYLYFWHYESKGGLRKQVKEYVGPSGDPSTRSEARRRCEAYYGKAEAQLRRLRGATLAALSAGR